jgi:hypothetical protein
MEEFFLATLFIMKIKIFNSDGFFFGAIREKKIYNRTD